MNTPSHAVLNLAVLGRRAHPEWNWPIVAGAVLPDVPTFLLWIVATFFWHQPQRQIWSETYFLLRWQIAVDTLHSFPLLALALAAVALLRLRRAQLLIASMLLHACGDVFLHGADAHRHFFPFSDYRFVSIVSYWDPAHYGSVVLPIEAAAVIGTSIFVWRIVRTRSGRGLLIATDALYVAAVVALAFLLKSPGAGAAEAQQSWSFGGPLPGATRFDQALVKKLSAKWAAREPGYRPRTRHLRADGSPKYTNRLFLESSLYLLQHGHNPTNWYSWSDEAFETARKLRRPVLLSVGYSTCHWCHVMEEESFEDEEIARTLNESYVAIKVDREERPDVDAVYMAAVQLLTGGGGWPMTVWLTPDRRPFYGGTYFPARDGDRGARVGFLTLLRKLREAYDGQPDRVSKASGEIVRAVREGLSAGGAGDKLPDASVLKEAFVHYRDGFDSTNGGLEGAPKFPSSLPVRFLLRYHRRTGDAQALQMATLTLEKMAAGGMYDHVGGGFHRYSTDAQWLVPHFEKMLYDNALLAIDYLEAYQATGREDFARIAREILRYVERDMTSKEGAFYSATDADSLSPSGRREEGYFFTWTPAEIQAAFGSEQARATEAFYAVTSHGNFEGRSILHTPRPLAEIARELNRPPELLRRQIEQARDALYVARARRPAPLRDGKILAAWNGLMISAYARAALALGDASYAARAAGAAEFVLGKMRKGGRLLRSYKDGQARHGSVLEDYAFLAAGLLDLYEATDEPRWLKEAIALDSVLERHYEDSKNGGFFLTPDDHESPLAREKPSYDGAEPSGNSVHVLNLLRLHELTTDDRYRKRAESGLRAFQDRLAHAPAALSEMLLALDFQLDVPKEIVIVTSRSRAEAEPLLAELRATFLPNRVLSVVAEGKDLAAQAKVVPLVEGKVSRKGQPTAYVCEKRVCELPTTDPRVFAGQIRKVQPLGEQTGAKPR